MKAILYVFLDVTIYVVQGLLLVMLLKAAQARFPFKKLYDVGVKSTSQMHIDN